ncbi:MAG: hypothetical protein KDH09_12815 [Chrysiogenetes bacterium]|nr:hypothetical protein [Chrysiogenetes bacterium]
MMIRKLQVQYQNIILGELQMNKLLNLSPPLNPLEGKLTGGSPGADVYIDVDGPEYDRISEEIQSGATKVQFEATIQGPGNPALVSPSYASCELGDVPSLTDVAVTPSGLLPVGTTVTIQGTLSL